MYEFTGDADVSRMITKRNAMKKLIFVYVIIFIFSVACATVVTDVETKALTSGMPNTVTLSNGDVVYDLNGEWDDRAENYGSWSGYGTYSNILKITQEGNSFVGIRMKNDLWNTAGSKKFRGELDKDGFKKVQIMTKVGPVNAKGQISEDGNKIIIDAYNKVILTLTRK